MKASATGRTSDGDPLNYPDTMKLRFLLVAVVFVFHAGLYFSFPFPDVGHLVVAVFFFLSGYGLQLSLERKDSYLSTMVQKRILGLMLQYWIVMVILAVVGGVAYLSWSHFANAVGSAFLTLPHWYITELVAFYILFFLSSMFGSWRSRVVFLVLSSVVFMWISSGYFLTDLYYKSGIAFVVGTIFAVYRERILSFTSRHLAVLMPLTAVLLMLSFRFGFGALDFIAVSITCILSCLMVYEALAVPQRLWFSNLALAAVGLAAVILIDSAPVQDCGAFMVMFAGLSALVVRIGSLSGPLLLLGSMSLELYLMHYETFNILSPYIVQTSVVVPVCAVVSIVIAYIAMRVCGEFTGWYNANIERTVTERGAGDSR